METCKLVSDNGTSNGIQLSDFFVCNRDNGHGRFLRFVLCCFY